MDSKKHEEMVQKANLSVLGKEAEVKATRFRQRYHFMAPAYWINDPNGLIHYNGNYHLFYQHHPYSPKWGAMHWGHAISKDLVHWEHLPIALAPSEAYDDHEQGGCFSGSAVDDNGILSLIYTGTSHDGQDFVQRQCLATSTDGISFTKYEGNPVIADPPAEGSKDFRDPKVWKHDSSWYMVTGSCRDGRGKALLHKSPDLKEWEYIGVLAESRGELGAMWECPDFYQLQGKHVLMFSPMGLYDRKVVYLTGDMDYRTGKFFWSTIGETDWGFDFYAPQSFSDDNGRNIIIGWANGWNWMPWWKGFGPTQEDQWCGAMSLPRVVSLCADGRLSFAPVEELKSLREECYTVSDLNVSGESLLQLAAGDGISYEIEAEIDLKTTDAAELGFYLRCSEKEKTTVTCDLKNAQLIFDRSASDTYNSDIRYCPLESASTEVLRLHIFVDTSSIEIFTDDGRTVMSSNIYPSQESTGTYFFVKGGHAKIAEIRTWGLSSIW